MSSVLERIVADTRADLATRRARVPEGMLDARVAALAPHAPGRLEAALRAPGLSLIAEFKRRSPSRGAIAPEARVEHVVPIYDQYAAAVSVLCDERHFGGGPEVLSAAGAHTSLPLLYKGFVVSRYQLLEARLAGASGVLLMASVLDDAALGRLITEATALGLDVLAESHTDAELARVLSSGATMVGVNSRNLHTMAIDLDAMLRRLAGVPSTLVRVAESGMQDAGTIARVREVADAALLGTALMASDDVGARIEALGWARRR
jgi:indole-3-glycerol phosphate synthase